MISNNPRAIEATIRRLTREIGAFDKIFYGTHGQSDRFLYAGMLEHKRDDFVRGAVLQMHTAIENMLEDLIRDKLLGVKPRQQKRRTRALRTIRGVAALGLLGGPQGLRFPQKVSLALANGLISTRTRKKLLRLNKLRNTCCHNWVLDVRIERNEWEIVHEGSSAPWISKDDERRGP